MHDVIATASHVTRKPQLGKDAAAIIETSLHGILVHGYSGFQRIQQRPLAKQTTNLDIESRSIQSIGHLNELPLGPADQEITEKFQHLYAMYVQCSYKLHQLSAISN